MIRFVLAVMLSKPSAFRPCSLLEACGWHVSHLLLYGSQIALLDDELYVKRWLCATSLSSSDICHRICFGLHQAVHDLA